MQFADANHRYLLKMLKINIIASILHNAIYTPKMLNYASIGKPYWQTHHPSHGAQPLPSLDRLPFDIRFTILGITDKNIPCTHDAGQPVG